MNWPIFVIWLDERRISNDFGYVLHSKSSARVTRSAVKKSNVNTRQMIRVERSHFHLTWLGIFMQNRQTSARAINHFGAVAHSDKVSTGKNDFSSLRSRQRGNFRRRKDEPNRWHPNESISCSCFDWAWNATVSSSYNILSWGNISSLLQNVDLFIRKIVDQVP